jgi:hypothetical protein
MGIPYSKQINAAFDEVTPLVLAGFEVIQTTKNIAILLAVIQVLTVIILSIVLLVLLALLVTVNPDLKAERQAIVTPLVRWGARLAMRLESHWRMWLIGALVVLLGTAIGATAAVYVTQTDFQRLASEERDAREGQGDVSKEVDADEG